MAELKIYSVNLEKPVVEWIDANAAVLGYSSRSEFVNEAIKEKKRRAQEENDNL